jgi:hypothetical protein
LAFLKAKLGYERALTGIDQALRASSVFFCAWVLSRRGAISAHAYMHKIESGADAGLMGITCYMVRPRARFM